MKTIVMWLLLVSSCFGQRVTLSPEHRQPIHEQIVRVECNYHGMTSYGSGLVLNQRDVLTALHCVHNSEMKVAYKGETLLAVVDRVNFNNDWAVLRLTKQVDAKSVNVRVLPLNDGDKVYAYGYGPVGGRLCWYASSVAGDRLTGQQPIEGDSGGPILDSDGKLCGIISARIEGPEREWFGFSVGKKFADWIRN